MKMKALFYLVLLSAAAMRAGASPARVDVLVNGNARDWKEHQFAGRSRYESTTTDDAVVLRARSKGTSSGIYKRIRIDLEKTPILRWRWRAENTLGDVDETSRAGDDYAARIGVVALHPVFFWRSRSVNYVWANRQPEESTWDNAYTDQAKMLAVRSGERHAGVWMEEARNVRADFRRLFGEDVRYIDVIGVMSDSDGSRGETVAYYGDIYFTDS